MIKVINYDEKKIVIGERMEDIHEFQVWWRGPTGLAPTLDMALQLHALVGIDVPFYMSWRPVPVALAANGLYEEISS